MTSGVIIVTGATSGIGLELVKKLNTKYKIIAIGRDKEKLDLLKKKIGNHHVFVCIDLTDPNIISKNLSFIDEPIYGFVHCAGTESVMPLRFINNDKFIDIMNLHVFSFIEIVKLIDKKKSKNDVYKTSIISISSYASDNGGAMQTLYSSSKSAIEALSKPLSKELASKKIRINSIKPGLVDTEMTDRWRKRIGIQDKEDLSNLQLGGIANPNDIVELIDFLLSDKSEFIIGSAINIDGGGPSSTLG